MKRFPLLLCLLSGSSVYGQIAGSFESFTEETNAKSWFLFDFGTPDQYFFPSWTLPDSTDAEIYAEFFGASGIALLADTNSSDQAFTGDYAAAGIAALSADIYVETPDNLDFFEFYFVSGGTFYYSNFLETDTVGWSTFEYSLKNDLWYFRNSKGDYVETELTDAILGTISEIGFDFFPLSDAADGDKIGIDNFLLLADLRQVEPDLAVSAEEGLLTFQAVPGLEYTVERSTDLTGNGWTEVEAPFELSGPYSHLFNPASKGFFRVKQVALYFEVPKVASSKSSSQKSLEKTFAKRSALAYPPRR